MTRFWPILGVALALFAQPLAAQSPLIVSSSQAAPIRASPPSGFFLKPGAQVAKTQVGGTYVILDEATIQSGLNANQAWVQIAPVDPTSGAIDLANPGWVYFGDGTSGATSPNFTTQALSNFNPGFQQTIIRQIQTQEN